MKGVILGIFMILAGVAMIYYHNQLYKMFGDISWAEKLLGDSRAIYPLIGSGLIVLGVLFIFGVGGSTSPTEIEAGFGK